VRTSPAEASPDLALSIRGLSAGYGGEPIIKDIDLDVHVGEVVAVLGANGSGKSTFVKAAVGEIALSQGRVSIFGRDVTGWDMARLAKFGVGYVPQLDDTFRSLSVKENLELGGYRVKKGDLSTRIEETYELFPVLRDLIKRRVDVLSGGERKMVGIARALMARPRLIFFDEPTAGLTPEVGQRVLTDAVRAAAMSGAGVVLVEQRVEEALKISDRAVVYVGGRVVIDRSAEELRNSEEIASLFLNAEPR
jgi:ABC-type branched-subunit amino acid transport system ATPase component